MPVYLTSDLLVKSRVVVGTCVTAQGEQFDLDFEKQIVSIETSMSTIFAFSKGHDMLRLYATMIVVAALIVTGSQAACNNLPPATTVVADDVVALAVETLADEIDSGTGGLAIDKDGNLFTADFGWRLGGTGKGGDKVFKVDPEGQVELFCRQMRGASGNTIDADGNLVQSSIGGNFISKVTPDGAVSVFAKGAFKNPVGITADSKNNLYVCNCGAGSITKVEPDGTTSTFAKSKLFNVPNGITLASDGNFYVANFGNGDVIKIDQSGNVSRFATLPGKNNGHLTSYKGQLFVVARTANQIYRVTLDGKATPFVGSGKRGKDDGKPLEASLSLPNDLGISPCGKYMYVNETSPISGDPRILGPTRIRRITLGQAPDSEPDGHANGDENSEKEKESESEVVNNSGWDDDEPKFDGPAASIDDLSWIAGHWRGEAMGGRFEETWTPPMAGEMLGAFKFVQDDKVVFYEVLTIVPKGDSLVLRLKHFSAEFVGWEEKDKSVDFPLVNLEPGDAKFNGIRFQKVNDGQMVISVDMKRDNTDPSTVRFECQRVDGPDKSSTQVVAMKRVFEADRVLAKVRDHFSETGSLDKAVSIYVMGLDNLDFNECPKSFHEAFVKHRDAWQKSVPFLSQHSELRGEMHELFDKIREMDEEVSSKLNGHFKSIMDTWTDVEKAAYANGWK